MSTAEFYDGLAGLGHRLLGSDTSLRAVQRARRECAAAGRHRDGLDQGLRPDPGQPSRQHPAAGLRVWQRPRDTYRAYTRAALSELATAAGLQDIRWHTPLDTNFFQPVMTAHSPT
jgi:hypothetical protein